MMRHTSRHLRGRDRRGKGGEASRLYVCRLGTGLTRRGTGLRPLPGLLLLPLPHSRAPVHIKPPHLTTCQLLTRMVYQFFRPEKQFYIE